MTTLYVRFRLLPMYEAALPQLIALLGEFSPTVEALPPTPPSWTWVGRCATSGGTPSNSPR